MKNPGKKHGIALICKPFNLFAMKSREIIRLLIADGWVLHSQKGSHGHYKHPIKTGRVTVPHPKKDLPIKTQLSILKQAGLR